MSDGLIRRVVVFPTRNAGRLLYGIRVKKIRGRSEHSRNVVARYASKEDADAVARELRTGKSLAEAQKTVFGVVEEVEPVVESKEKKTPKEEADDKPLFRTAPKYGKRKSGKKG